MKDIKPKEHPENYEKNNSFEGNQENIHTTSQISSVTKENSPSSKSFIGKKLSGDAELILWLSGKELNNKNIKEEEGFSEINSKIKKKLIKKLYKNAKKCEHHFVHKCPDDECINVQCSYCLKRNFNHNELIRFTNYDDFMHYLKYIFYLSDKVLCYSVNTFKSNKKIFDGLFSKFKKKEEKWEFDQEKIICKFCMLKLINKPDFIQKIKNIFIYGENEKSYNIDDGDIIIELNSDINKVGKNKPNNKNSNEDIEKYNFVVEKYNNNDTYRNSKKKEAKNSNNYSCNDRFFYNFNNNNPNCLNIYNSNNININIKNNNKIINNYIDNNSYNSFFYLCESIKNNNNSIKDIQPKEVNFYWQQLFNYNHNKITILCNELQREINNLRNFLNNNDMKKEGNEKENFNFQMIVETSKERTLCLLGEISNCIIINDNYINTFFKDLNNNENYIDNINKEKLYYALIENENNIQYIRQIIYMYMSIIQVYLFKFAQNIKN